MSRRHNGFTLLEVTVTVAILSLGLVGLSQAFFTSIEAFSYAQDYLNIRPWMDELVWKVQDDLQRYGDLINKEASDSLIVGNKRFSWHMQIEPIETAEKYALYRLTLNVFWRMGRRRKNISREIYLRYAQK